MGEGEGEEFAAEPGGLGDGLDLWRDSGGKRGGYQLAR